MKNNRNIIFKKILVWIVILSPIFSFANEFLIDENRPQDLPNAELIDSPNSQFSKSITLNQILRKSLPKNLFKHFYQTEITNLALFLNHFNHSEFLQLSNQYLSYLNTKITILFPQLFQSSKKENPLPF